MSISNDQLRRILQKKAQAESRAEQKRPRDKLDKLIDSLSASDRDTLFWRLFTTSQAGEWIAEMLREHHRLQAQVGQLVNERIERLNAAISRLDADTLARLARKQAGEPITKIAGVDRAMNSADYDCVRKELERAEKKILECNTEYQNITSGIGPDVATTAKHVKRSKRLKLLNATRAKLGKPPISPDK